MSHPTQSLSRAISVLSCFTAERTELTLSEIAALTGLSKATLLRYLEPLRSERLVERTGNTYHLGLGAFELGANYLARLDLHKLGRRHMEQLAERCSETASLASRDGGEVVYLDIVRGQAEIGIQSRIGARQPAQCTALGKVLLAWSTEADREQFVYSRPMVRLTPNTICTRRELEDELARVRDQGYAIDNEERLEGIRCVAAPIRDYTGAVIAAISVSGAAFRMQDDRMDVARESAVQTACLISGELGWRAPAASALP